MVGAIFITGSVICNLLTCKLNYYGIQDKTNTWIHNFLSNRTQAVLWKGEASDYIPVMSGVPQDSVLEPSLFLFNIMMTSLTV